MTGGLLIGGIHIHALGPWIPGGDMFHDAPEDRGMADPYATLPFDQIQSHLEERVRFFERLQRANPSSAHAAERLQFYRNLRVSHMEKLDTSSGMPF